MSDTPANPMNFDPTRVPAAPVRAGLHPLLAVTAASLIAVSATGVAYFTGVLPNAKSTATSPAAAAPAPMLAQAANTAVMPIPGSGSASAPLVVVTPPTEPAKVMAPVPPVAVVAPIAAPVKPAPKVVAQKPAVRAAKTEPYYGTGPVTAQTYPPSNGRVMPPTATAPITQGTAQAPAQPPVASQNPSQSPTPPVASGPVLLPSAPTGRVEPPVQVAQACTECGRVESIREVKVPGNPSGAGVLVGGAIGGVIGNQVGRGNGRAAATVLGAIGGAMLGNMAEKQNATATRYDVTVRMEDGSIRNNSYNSRPNWSVGQQVRVVNGTIANADGSMPMRQASKPRQSSKQTEPIKQPDVIA